MTPDSSIDTFVRALDGASPFVPIAANIDTPALGSALREAGWRVLTLDRAPVVDKATLMHALYQSGRCPAGFGFNWDALLDTLRDLEWLEPCHGIAFVWRHPDVLATRAPEVATTFREVVDDACAARAERGHPPLRVLVPAGTFNDDAAPPR